MKEVFNRRESKIRSHGVGILRAKASVALANLVYNIARLCRIKRYNPQWITT